MFGFFFSNTFKIFFYAFLTLFWCIKDIIETVKWLEEAHVITCETVHVSIMMMFSFIRLNIEIFC